MEKITVKPDWAFNSYFVYTNKNIHNYSHIVFDLSNCSIVDSEALKLIYKLKKDGKKVEVLNLPPVCQKIVEKLDIKDIFQECSSTHL